MKRVPVWRPTAAGWRGESRPAERIALSAARDREAILYQFSSHEVQLITADLIGTEPIIATGNISYEDADTTVLQFLGFNTARAPFQDSAARRGPGPGHQPGDAGERRAVRTRRAAQFPVSPVSPLYPAELESLYSYDDFAAAMEAAGLNTGRTRTVTLLVNQENTFKVSAAEHIAQALSDFDLQIQVEALPWEEYAAALAAGNFDLYYGEVRLPANWDLSCPGGHRRQSELRRLGGSPDGAAPGRLRRSGGPGRSSVGPVCLSSAASAYSALVL